MYTQLWLTYSGSYNTAVDDIFEQKFDHRVKSVKLELDSVFHQLHSENSLTASLNCNLCSTNVFKLSRLPVLYKLHFRPHVYCALELLKSQFQFQYAGRLFYICD